MQRFLTIAAVSLAALGVAGCASAPRGALSAENNTGLYSLHQPVVERTDYVFDVRANGDRLTEAEQGRLDAWFASIQLRYGDRLSIDGPGGQVSDGVARDIGRVAGHYGLLLSEGAPVTQGDIQPGEVRVIASRAHARVPDCPTWSDPGIADTTTTSTNFGCAVNTNLAAQIADPNDLVLGREGSLEGNTATATRAIHSYRTRPANTQTLPTTSTTSSNGSSGGSN